MKIYLALLITIGTSISIIAGSLVFFLWISGKYDANAFEYKAAKIATIWLDCLISLAASYFFVNTMAQEIKSHPMMTTAILLMIISGITAFAYNHRRYLPVVCAGCAFPFLVYGIWFDPTDYYASPFWFMVGWAVVSLIYVGCISASIEEAKKADLKAGHQPPCSHNKTSAQKDSPCRKTAIDAISDIIERGAHGLGIE